MPLSVPYQEPGIETILVFASFLLLLNILNHVVNKIAYCGLVAQILIGVAWGTPGGGWLHVAAERIIVQLGYLGLILLVYEGGLSTSFKSLKANLTLSICVALTGILFPIGLSYALLGIVGASPLQAFAAGASLCSTSLGTTFTVLSTSGLATTRMGVVLSSAAMMDDVVGLVMVQVISNLGQDAASFSSITVVRPIFVSLAFALVVPLGARFLVQPLTLKLNAYRRSNQSNAIDNILQQTQGAFLIHTAILIALVTGTSYAGTSNLFAAYLAGAAISWWDSEVPHCVNNNESTSSPKPTKMIAPTEDNEEDQIQPAQLYKKENANINKDEAFKGPPERNERNATEGKIIYETYYQEPVDRILKPFFFASIGFSIPISQMFTGELIWRGVVYTILMMLGKMVCGAWLVRFPVQSELTGSVTTLRKRLPAFSVSSCWPWRRSSKKTLSIETRENSTNKKVSSAPQCSANQTSTLTQTKERMDTATKDSRDNASQSSHPHRSPNPKKPLALYPAAIVGSAMTARGEIGFLISSIAEGNGVFGSEPNSDLFLVVTWAILLCTVIGPICVGGLVKRVKRLEKRKNGDNASDVLGVWGVGK